MPGRDRIEITKMLVTPDAQSCTAKTEVVIAHQKWWIYLVTYSTWSLVGTAHQNMVEIFTLTVVVKTSKIGGILPQIQCTIYNENSVLAIILVHKQLSSSILKGFNDSAL